MAKTATSSEYIPKDRYAGEIMRQLDKITPCGRRQSEIFEDWLEIVHACLTALPGHLESVAAGNGMAEDTPETQAMFERIWRKYDPKTYAGYFQNAMGLLLKAAEAGMADKLYHDVIGEVYMAWGIPNRNTGQFFTPYDLAHVMANVTVGQGEQMVHDRLKEAVYKSTLASAAVVAGQIIEDAEEAKRWFFERVLPPAMEYYEPVTVSDPACGSGVMLLAAAAQFPAWMTTTGLVQFWGQDIDATCVRMAQINMMLYRLNGYGARLLAAEGQFALRAPVEAPAPVQAPAEMPIAPKAQVGQQLSLF